VPRRRVGQEIEIERIIAVLEERPLAPVAALRHVMRHAGQDHAAKTGHAFRLSRGLGWVNYGDDAPVTVIQLRG